MSRATLLLLGVVFAVQAAGCAHCDTCDDIPTNCVDRDCGISSYSGPPATMMDPDGPMLSPVTSMQPIGPAQPAPFSTNAPLAPPTDANRPAPLASPPSSNLPIVSQPGTSVTPPQRPASPQP